jgi:ubiquitin-activating enzyme E1 C
VEKRIKGVKITPYVGKIQDKDEDYYMQFKIIVCGLDSVEARRWINSTLVGIVDTDDPESLKSLIDGGTEGVFISKTPTLCTIATIPRQPQHCIEWAHQIA